MLENCKNAKERWGGVSEIIDRWLQERQQLLVCFCEMTNVDDFVGDDDEQADRLGDLCEILVDYVSAGHFEVYDQLAREGREFNDEAGLNLASGLYAVIDPTTEVVLDFNEKYQEIDDLSSLREDLSELGSALEQRFKAEDRMISVLHDAHRNMVA